VLSRRSLIILAAALSGVWAASVSAQTPAGAISKRGTYEGGRYTIEVPANWNGALVVFAHGFRGTSSSPLASHVLDRGFALATTSFRTDAYRADWFVDDMRLLRELFIREVRQPRYTIVQGRSMGGHVAIASLEIHPDLYQGALIECGVIDGIGIADFYMAARAAAEYLGGVDLFDIADRDALVRRVSERWLPLMGKPPNYTERGKRFDSVLKHLMGGDVPLRLQGLPPYYIRYITPERSSDNEELLRHATNVHVRYEIDPGLGVTSDELNAKVRRILPAPGARSHATNPAFAELTGQIKAPVLAIHETADGRVPWSLQQSYRRRTVAAGTSHLLVQRAVRWPGHCSFAGETLEQGFDDLVAWIEKGVKPDGDDVLAPDVAKLGLKWTPIRHVEDRP
jgi:pimeloyl-ACP methyl ester carboxylesterase